MELRQGPSEITNPSFILDKKIFMCLYLKISSRLEPKTPPHTHTLTQILSPGPQLVALFKVVKPSRGRTQLEEVGPWAWILKDAVFVATPPSPLLP